MPSKKKPVGKKKDSNPLPKPFLGDYADATLEEVGRSRAYAVQYTPINTTSNNNSKLSRSSSIVPQNQANEGTCFAYSSARVITRYITQIIPDEFTLDDEESTLLYSNDLREDNCFFYNSKNIEDVRNALSINRCSVDKRYNYMILFYYTLFTIKKKFGCSGVKSSDIKDILETFGMLPTHFYGLTMHDLTERNENYIISPEIDEKAIQLILKFYNVITDGTNKLRPENIKAHVEVDRFPLNQNISQRENWITNFPEGAKAALKNNMYVAFVFSMPKNQWQTIRRTNLFDINPVLTDPECTPPIGSHAVVITNWEQEGPTDPAYVTIVNSWGPDWGTNGFIRLSSENYYKFVMNPNCKEDYDYQGPGGTHNMKFMYFEVKKNKKPYKVNELTSQTAPQLTPEIVPESKPEIVPQLTSTIVPELEKKSETILTPVPSTRTTNIKTRNEMIRRGLFGGKSKKYRKSKKHRKTKKNRKTKK